MDSWTRFLDLGQPQVIFVVLLSLLLPLSIFVGRRNVRVRRLGMIDNLGSVLAHVPQDSGSFIAPALELVRARYVGSGRGAGPWARTLDWLKEIGIYLLPTGIFVLLSACGFALVVGLGGDWLAATKGLLRGLRGEDGVALDFGAATALVLGAAFVGAYIWSIDFLILRIANFDLSPLSFLRAAGHVLMTVFVAWVLCQVVAAPGIREKVAVTVVLGIAFLSGLYPSLGLNVLVERLPHWLRLKRDVAAGERHLALVPARPDRRHRPVHQVSAQSARDRGSPEPGDRQSDPALRRGPVRAARGDRLDGAGPVAGRTRAGTLSRGALAWRSRHDRVSGAWPERRRTTAFGTASAAGSSGW